MKTRSDDLAIFLAVVDQGSFSGAATLLNEQVGKVSRSVSKLEKQLGITLLNRTTRRVELTDEGRTFETRVRKGLCILEEAEEQLLVSKDNPSGTLRVDAASPLLIHQVAKHMGEFRELYPNIKVELTSNEGYVDLLEKRTDLAFRIGPLSDSTLHARLLGTSALHMLASPGYLDRYGVPATPEDLSKHRLIGFTDIPSLNRWPIKGLKEVELDLSSTNGEVIRQMALNDGGITCLSNFMVKEDIAQGRLIPILTGLIDPMSDRRLVNAVYYRSSSISSRISVFLDFIQQRLEL